MKDLKISKELIKAVLEKETETLSKDFNFTINEDYIEFSDDGEMQFEYCIYKFAFKCKEWAIKQNRELRTSVVGRVDFYDCNNDSEFMDCFEYIGDTECEAISKACEWLLSEVNK